MKKKHYWLGGMFFSLLSFTICSKKATVLENMPPEANPTIVFFGDSLTAGYGLRPAEAFPSIIQRKLKSHNFNHITINAGVSGDTTADGLARLHFYLRPELNVQHFVIFLGANDAMRAIPLTTIRDNLRKIIRRVKEQNIPYIYLVELKAFKSMYSPYRDELPALYRELAREENILLLPFFLDGVADVTHLNMADGIHPTAEGMAIVAENVWYALEPHLRAANRAGDKR